MEKPQVTINIACADLDRAVEKANRLVELLKEAATIIDSLSPDDGLEA